MENNICKICEKEIDNNYNFCPYCGAAVTEIAKRLNKEKCDIIRLKLINDLTDKIEDKGALSVLNKEAKKISK